MNNIQSNPTDQDELNAKVARKSPAAYAREILNILRVACPFGTTFIEEIPYELRRTVEQKLQYVFELWANTYISPLCREIISKSK